jgi:hypothetical protein
MLDMGFAGEMEDCLKEIKKKVPYKFSDVED